MLLTLFTTVVYDKNINHVIILDMMCDDEELCKCPHEESHRDRSIWIKPHRKDNIHSPAQRRTYCKICGKIRYKGSYPAKKMGFYINLLKEIQKRSEILRRRSVTKHSLTQVQIRLIIIELREDEFFSDRFSTSSKDQLDLFKSILKRKCPLPDDVIDTVINDFKG